jgi:TonB family protein
MGFLGRVVVQTTTAFPACSFLARATILFIAGSGMLTAVPMNSSVAGRVGETLADQEARVYALSTVAPYYSYQALRNKIGGSGVYEMRVNTKTGRVKEVVVVSSAGNRILDRVCIWAFSQWRFKPQTIASVRVPVTFEMRHSDASKWVF